ncbi:HD domain-containing phosphohydrolase [Vibrio agarivorans]|uniref:HD domain-containing phosphohydrolase n=1 Tax=Vibrio agarivorans TaxID=153622 RepID=A0ABT7Y5W4_9VIBR|nr:HD domain-containing phosphohydrolase [Vibrio agarivorans]MDN2483448.1 HD domain-containing phosphohydrolase [Vibrio agarivorans]
MTKRRYSLTIHITSLFLVLTSIAAMILVITSYQHSQGLLNKSAEELSSENSAKLEITFESATAPIFTSLDFVANGDSLNRGVPLHQNRGLIASLVTTFEKNTELVGMYYASKDGEMNVIRLFTSESDTQKFGAPSDAKIMIHEMDVKGKNNLYFLSPELDILSQNIKNDNEFDPRSRPWYRNTRLDGAIQLTEPYFFYELKTTGVTLSRRSTDGNFVIGADFTLDSLSGKLHSMAFSEHTKLILFDRKFNLLAHHNIDTQLATQSGSYNEIKAAVKTTVFDAVFNRFSDNVVYKTVNYEGVDWSVTIVPVMLNNDIKLRLAEATPHDDLLDSLLSMRDKQVQVAFIMLIMSLGIIWFVSNKISTPLKTLITLTSNITRFEFKKTRYPSSIIKEVSNLTHSIQLMEHTLHDMLKLLRETASNRDFALLSKTICKQSYQLTKAESIVLFTTRSNTEDNFDLATNMSIIPFKLEINKFIDDIEWLREKLEHGETVHLQRNQAELQVVANELYTSDNYLFPIRNKNNKLVGLLFLGYEREITPEQSDKHEFLKELLSFAEIAKENITQIEQQKEMLNGFISLIASAIDTKSPYTGSHCQRIPELTTVLTQVAHQDTRYFPEFEMIDSQWEALHLAAWLHDCGKVTTPEYIVDKATKLETIYDRIHEVRMRFELLKSEATTEYWQSIANGSDASMAKNTLIQKHQQLDDDFYFVAQCNLGSEFMSDEAVKRLQRIADQEWTRTLDDQAGISWIEKERAGPKISLPVKEKLIADKQVHRVGWGDGVDPKQHWSKEFALEPGELKFNQGELYNLSVRRGTLNDDERFLINDHVIQTINMLNRLPYPDHLKDVPEIAGGHHERMDGKGYPLGLNGDELSVPARVMAIADVFEALTSSDRPYKKGKTLDEAIGIMTSMATSGHIDPKLYLLFLENEVDQQYANDYLTEDQKCHFDRKGHIQKVKEYIKEQAHTETKECELPA